MVIDVYRILPVTQPNLMRGLCNLCVEGPYSNSPPYQVSWPNPCGRRDTKYLVCQVILQGHDQRIYGRKLHSICNHPNYLGSGYKVILDCCVISQDHVTKELSDIMSTSPSSLVAISTEGSRDITDLIFHMTLHNHLIKGPSDFTERSSSFW